MFHTSESTGECTGWKRSRSLKFEGLHFVDGNIRHLALNETLLKKKNAYWFYYM